MISLRPALASALVILPVVACYEGQPLSADFMHAHRLEYEALLRDFTTLRDKYGVDSLRVREGKVEFSTFDKRPLPSDADGTRLLQHVASLAPSLVLSAHLSQDGIFSSIVWSGGATSGGGVA